MTKWSEAIEDYLKHIYMLGEGAEVGAPDSETAQDRVGGQALARRIGISHASVTAMLKRLHDLGLVDYEAYQGVSLTVQGRAIALEVIRHHRLVEAYLADVLGMSWDEVHDEAEVLEHHISERVEQLMADKLGNPRFDPHGHPIPTLEGDLPERDGTRSLAHLTPGERAVVRSVRNEHREMLQYLTEIGVEPERELTVQAQAPLGGPLTIINDNGATHALGRDIAECIDVS